VFALKIETIVTRATGTTVTVIVMAATEIGAVIETGGTEIEAGIR